MIKVIVNGSKGKMGSEVVQAVKKDPNLTLISTCDIEDNLSQVLQKVQADIVVDFTHPAAVLNNTRIILESGANAVIGTTGLSDENLKEIKSLCEKQKLSCLVSPNFCIGAVLMMKFATLAAKYMKQVEIIEYHHDKKADAPSGTAIKTAQMLESNWKDLQGPELESKELLFLRAQGSKIGNIRIHSIRLPGFVASQEVLLGSSGETLKISHHTIHREAFMSGILLACKTIMEKEEKTLYYGLENFLEEKS